MTEPKIQSVVSTKKTQSVTQKMLWLRNIIIFIWLTLLTFAMGYVIIKDIKDTPPPLEYLHNYTIEELEVI
jgi:uncharacterized protein with PQ loop repeat